MGVPNTNEELGDKVKRVRTIIESLEDWISGIFIVGAIFILFVGVIFRYVLGLPTTWQDEFARYLVVWGTLIGASVALRDNSHIRVEILYNMFADKAKRWINLFANLVTMTFFVFLIVYGSGLVETKFITGQTSTSGFPLWIIYLILPFAGTLLALRTVERLVRLCLGKKESEHDEQILD